MRPSSAEYSKSIKPTKWCQNIKISWSGCQQHHFYCGTQKKYWFICCLNTTVQNDAAASSLFQGNRKLSPNHVWTRVISSERSQRKTEHWSASSEWKRSVDQKLGSIKASNIYTKLIVSNWFCILAQRKKTQTKGKGVLHLWPCTNQESQMTKGFLSGREADSVLHGCNLLNFSAKQQKHSMKTKHLFKTEVKAKIALMGTIVLHFIHHFKKLLVKHRGQRWNQVTVPSVPLSKPGWEHRV